MSIYDDSDDKILEAEEFQALDELYADIGGSLFSSETSALSTTISLSHDYRAN